MLIVLPLKNLIGRQRNKLNHETNFQKTSSHISYFSQQSSWEECLENLMKANSKMIKHCAVVMKNLNNMLKELIREYEGDE